MPKKKVKEKIYISLEQWKKDFLPALVENEGYQRIREAPEKLGILFAEESLNKLSIARPSHRTKK